MVSPVCMPCLSASWFRKNKHRHLVSAVQCTKTVALAWIASVLGLKKKI